MVFSLEMPREQVCKAAAVHRCGESTAVLIKRPQNLTAEDWSRLAVAAQEADSDAGVGRRDTDPTVVAIRAKARRVAASAERGRQAASHGRGGLPAHGRRFRHRGREQQVAANFEETQETGEGPGRGCRRPLADESPIRAEGQGCRTAALGPPGVGRHRAGRRQVIFLHANGQDPEGVVTVIGAKSRTFGTWRTKLHFDAVHTRFLDYDGLGSAAGCRLVIRR